MLLHSHLLEMVDDEQSLSPQISDDFQTVRPHMIMENNLSMRTFMNIIKFFGIVFFGVLLFVACEPPHGSTTFHNFSVPNATLTNLQASLHNHEIYTRITTHDQLSIFMQTHVFAVLDFMFLLKSLQKAYTNTNVMWTSTNLPKIGRFVNSIVVGEETDEIVIGNMTYIMSHFELYKLAMHEVGCDTTLIDSLVNHIKNQQSPTTNHIRVWLHQNKDKIGNHVLDFVLTTLMFVDSDSHITASAFLYGREDPIPQMFRNFLEKSTNINNYPFLKAYMERHIEVDSGEHGPMARQILNTLTTSDKIGEEIENAGKIAIQARINLWSGVVNSLS